jgi:hypothetical protein
VLHELRDAGGDLVAQAVDRPGGADQLQVLRVQGGGHGPGEVGDDWARRNVLSTSRPSLSTFPQVTAWDSCNTPT